MIFSSLSSYLDPPSWHQQQNIAGGVLGEDGVETRTGGGTGTASGGGDHEMCQLPPPLLPPPPPPSLGSDGATGRSFQIPDPRRMTKLPPPDTAMKCPRCESTNTKFCYFNNYSLSQPRHFCKTCRRYWTRGGALRNVPVGGSCRRNKKTNKGSRSSRSKSPCATTPITSTSSPHISPNFPILPPFNHLGGGDLGLTDMINLGHDHSNYTRTKFPNFGVINQASDSGIYGQGSSGYGGQVAGLKMEEIHHHHQQQQHQEMNLSRNFVGISGNDQFLGTSNIAWGTSDHLNGFASSSTTPTTSHLL